MTNELAERTYLSLKCNASLAEVPNPEGGKEAIKEVPFFMVRLIEGPESLVSELEHARAWAATPPRGTVCCFLKREAGDSHRRIQSEIEHYITSLALTP